MGLDLQTKERGGLGFRSLRVLNNAYMMKLAWCLVAHPEKPWVQVMKAKYKCGGNRMPAVFPHTRSSSTWRAICQVWPTMTPHLSWVVRNGVYIRFWRDAWIPGLPSRELNSSVAPPDGQDNFSVMSYARNGEWKWDVLNQILPHNICAKIASIRPPTPGEDDMVYWSPSSDGIFSLKTAYSMIIEDMGEVSLPTPLFPDVWQWRGLERVKGFLWKLAHGRLLTNDERQRRHMCQDATCNRCSYLNETISHCLRDCKDVRELWEKVIHPDHYAKFFSLGIQE